MPGGQVRQRREQAPDLGIVVAVGVTHVRTDRVDHDQPATRPLLEGVFQVIDVLVEMEPALAGLAGVGVDLADRLQGTHSRWVGLGGIQAGRLGE